MPYKDVTKRRIYACNWMKIRRNEWIQSQGGCCCKCGSTKNLEVDHINPKTKTEHKVWSWRKERREKELIKCQILCHACHKKKNREDGSLKIGMIHGTHSGYASHGYRCEQCRIAHRKYNQMKRIKV